MKARHRRAAHRLYMRVHRSNAALYAEAEPAATRPILALGRLLLAIAYSAHYCRTELFLTQPLLVVSERKAKRYLRKSRESFPALLRAWNPNHFMLTS